MTLLLIKSPIFTPKTLSPSDPLRTPTAAACFATMPKHYRAPGKKKEGNSAKYITRSKAVKYLQVNLSTFRRLCILKGIFPREPKKKFEGNHKTYYHMKDINFLLHEPLLEKFREIRTYDKKVRKAVAKKNEYRAEYLEHRRPNYKLDRLIKERYPKFIDALRDLDDCLTMVHLFAAIPAVENERIDVKRIHNCQRLSHEWQAYICRTHSLRKTFISVKGIYYQAEVEGQKITWLTPHALQQVLTDDVDFNVMLTFLEFNETLLAFVNCKLYHSINIKYPPILDPELEAFAADLYALSRYLDAGSSALSSSSNGMPSGYEQIENDDEEKSRNMEVQVPVNEAGTLMHLIGDASAEDNEDKETKECKALFKNLNFFLGREVPKESMQFTISAFGGAVSWEGDKCPIKETDEQITHQIVDRTTQGHLFLSRDYVQPQWVYDCVNSRIILPTEPYMVGRVPPPHLSPFVDNEAEGYVPEYAETIKRLQAAARKQIMPMPGADFASPDDLLVEGVIDRTEAREAAEMKQKLMNLEKQHHEELAKEIQGVTYSSLSKETKTPVEVGDLTNEDLSVEQILDDAQNITKVVMPRKKRKLLEAIEISKERKKANVNLLKERKKKAESKTKT